MKYGESTFDILYLLFAIISGCVILARAKNRTDKLMGTSALVLGLGDAFHLVPRVLNYFVDADFTAALGIGKLVTSVTMTVFYILLCYLWKENYKTQDNNDITTAVWRLTAVRIILCLLPQNDWIHNSTEMIWGIIRNIPFVILGAIVCCLYFSKQCEDRLFKPMWIYIMLSFLFYIPVAVGAGIVPTLGMLMLPKTICYILIICTFHRKQRK